jgi:hypothetical protein
VNRNALALLVIAIIAVSGLVVFAFAGTDGTSMTITFYDAEGEAVYVTSTQDQTFELIPGALKTADGQTITTADIVVTYEVTGKQAGSTCIITANGDVKAFVDGYENIGAFATLPFEEAESDLISGKFTIPIDLELFTQIPDSLKSVLPPNIPISIVFSYTLDVVETLADGTERSDTELLTKSISCIIVDDVENTGADIKITGEIDLTF